MLYEDTVNVRLLTKVKQKANVKACCSQVIVELSCGTWRKMRTCLEFQNHKVVDEEVQTLERDRNAIVDDFYWNLALNEMMPSNQFAL